MFRYVNLIICFDLPSVEAICSHSCARGAISTSFLDVLLPGHCGSRGGLGGLHADLKSDLPPGVLAEPLFVGDERNGWTIQELVRSLIQSLVPRGEQQVRPDGGSRIAKGALQ